MTDENRRPIAARTLRPIRALATRLAASDVTPNQISQASIGFAVVAFLAFLAVPYAGPVLTGLALLLAALAIQLRLLCNLLDGLVAIEGGKSTATGAFWNGAPDRVADILILWGFGLAVGQAELGLLAAALAIGTAYVRELGRAEGFAPDFGGPLAKPQRMALVTFAALIAAVLAFGGAAAASAIVLALGLWITVVGIAVTILLRSMRLLRLLKLRG